MAMSKKRKQKYIGLLVLLLVCAAVFSGYAVLLKNNTAADDEEEETTAETLENLFDIVNTDVVQVYYRVEDEALTFVRESSDDEWHYAEDESLPIDQSAVSAVVSTACAITVSQEIASSLSDQASFGLETPAYEVILTAEDGTEYVLYVGDTTGSSTEKRYAYVEGDERIISIPNTIVTKLNVDLQSLLSVESYPSVDSDTITRLYYEDANQTMELFNNPEDLSLAEAIGTTTWYYKEDGVYMPLHQSNSSTLLDTITGITFEACEDYEADDEEMAEYGLADPVAKLTVEYTVTEDNLVETETTNDSGSTYVTETVTSEESFTLNIGNKCADEAYYYVSLDDKRTVYKVAAEDIELFTENNLSDYCMSLYPTLCNFDGIEQIDVSYDDRTMQITVTQTQDTDEDGNETTTYNCKLNGEDYGETDTRSIFSSLIRVTADHIIADEDINTDSEVIFSCTFTTSYEKKPEITFEISELDSIYYQLSLNGRTKYAITKQEFNTLISNIEDYLQ